MKDPLPILILNGPNLNMLGVREPETYGSATLADLESLCRTTAQGLGVQVECRQSNDEGELVTWIQQARTKHGGVIVNAGGYSHTSVAILDALLSCEKPVIEVHISNIFRREEFRHHSLVSQAAKGVICGLGLDGYALALQAMAKILKND
ncbi:MAG: type II 3-dehydroquinate dehydratase [Bdellovibrionales bacterium]